MVGRDYTCRRSGDRDQNVLRVGWGGRVTSFGQVSQETVGFRDVRECLGYLMYLGESVKGYAEEVNNE